MKRYITGKTGLTKLWAVVLSVSLCTMFSCTDETEGTPANGYNISMEVSTRAGGTAADLIPSMRLFTFYNDVPAEQKFRQELRNITRTSTTLSTQIETGVWNLSMVSTPGGGTLIAPVANTPIASLPLYKYEPSIVNGKSTDAAEIFLDYKTTPNIVSGDSHTMSAQLNRTVAKVQIVVRKTTANFKEEGTHSIELDKIPSSISYVGGLLPSKSAPELLNAPLKAGFKLRNLSSGYMEATDTISFIIPAHQGTDFLSNTPKDTITTNMKLAISLERTGGSQFEEEFEIPLVAKCNKILRVLIDVNDGLACHTEVLDWERVDFDSTVGQEYSNWLYVKKGASGSGLSWSDPLPDINTAMSKAAALKAKNKTVHDILVAGGSSLIYNEGLDIPADTKIYGGWVGTPGTELAKNDAAAPHTSTHRNLKDYKAHIATNESIVLSNSNSALDGFVIAGTGKSDKDGLVVVSNSTAWINAVEIDNSNAIVTPYALSISNGLATNVLVSRNNKGVSLTGGGQLVNATIANNSAASAFNGTLLNTVYWGNTPANPTTTLGTIQYCAFEGTNESMPSGTNQSNNYPLNNDNTAWFTTTNVLPGPHFNLTQDASKPRYVAGTDNPTRAPQLGRGNQTAFDNVTTVIPGNAKKDINGNPRHNLGTDIGCYEDTTYEGFKLRWGSDRVYISSKAGYDSDIPLLLPDNKEHNIGVHWEVTVVGNATGSSSSLSYSTLVGSTSGQGTGEMVGQIRIIPNSPDYLANAERKCGVIRITTDLGAYLPNEDIEVWQTPGAPAVWSDGYVGSFHRNNERGARYITGPNTGAWTARIINGLDWIKIDGNERDFGADIMGELHPKGGYHKEVTDTYGGVVSGSGPIKFRVGMKSENNSGTPRYGLIVITRGGGVAMFFVRQGEEADYLYGPDDPRSASSQVGRQDAKKFPPFNVVVPSNIAMVNGGVLINTNGTEFTKYPTMVGDYFQGNSLRAYRRGIQTSTLTRSTINNGLSENPCPPGYRYGTLSEWVHSVYQNVAVTPSANVDPKDEEARRNFVWGRYADGLYDQYAPDPISATTNRIDVGNHTYVAKGILMVNHYNLASLFFPQAGLMFTGNPNWEYYYNANYSNPDYCFYNTSTRYGSTNARVHNTHWTGAKIENVEGHVGMSCTASAGNTALNTGSSFGYAHGCAVRCVKE